MEIDETTAASLGAKLARMDLTNEEGLLLTALLTPEQEADVAGFSVDPARPDGYKLHKVKDLLPPVLGPVEKNWSFGATNSGS